MKAIAYSNELQCVFSAWRVLADSEIALEMPAGNCCDMTGAIEIAQKIMPSVWRIATFVDGKSDVEYRFWKGEWISCEPT